MQGFKNSLLSEDGMYTSPSKHDGKNLADSQPTISLQCCREEASACLNRSPVWSEKSSETGCQSSSDGQTSSSNNTDETLRTTWNCEKSESSSGAEGRSKDGESNTDSDQGTRTKPPFCSDRVCEQNRTDILPPRKGIRPSDIYLGLKPSHATWGVVVQCMPVHVLA